MPRRREVPKREILPDPKFGNVEVAKFMNVLMLAARSRLPNASSTARSTRSKRRQARTPRSVLRCAQQREAGGGSEEPPRWRCQLPGSGRSASVASYGIGDALAARGREKRSEKSMALRLAGELLEAAEGRGGAMKKRDEVHRMAEANKAFSHFRF
jgi:small subunit ribosomal protein S7